jgi:hypothetical protein
MKPSISTYFVFASVASLVLGAILGYAFAVYQIQGPVVYPNGTSRIPNSFEECVMAGNPVMESYPRQCRSNGRTFVEDVKAVPPTQPPATPPTGSTGKCVIGGCSAQICGLDTGEPIVSTCEFRAEYACYKGAKCEKQADGQCGWTPTAELQSCLKNPPDLR